ncbi:MAG: sensor histidine kinase [Burkholderiaceae bacterium]
MTNLLAIAGYLGHRRDAILKAWRARVTADPKLTTGASLPRSQLQDHLPALLEDFEHRLRAEDADARAASQDEQKGDAAAHGLHRWQQGFDLGEVSRELGRLNQCLVAELERCAITEPMPEPTAIAEARRIWAEMYSVALASSTSQFFKLQQIESAGHVADLEHALDSLRDLERERAVLWQQAAHDLRGNLGVVVMATAGLTSVRATEDGRAKFLGSLDRNVNALHRLLEDVTSLARLQGGQEIRTLAAMDASLLLRDLDQALQAFANERGLALSFEGPLAFPVLGDATKIRRIVQNLALNAIKYTRVGGVAVSWGEIEGVDADRWFVQIRDSGPGFDIGPRAALAGALGLATDLAKDMDADCESGDVTHVERGQVALRRSSDTVAQPPLQAGEGIGLSIVKRLCTLLDATIEFESRPGQGTTFRLLLPKDYPA